MRDLAATAGSCDVFPVGAITRGLEGESLAEIGEMAEAGVRVFTDDGRSVPTARLLRNALTYAKAFPPTWCSRSMPRTLRSSKAGRCKRAHGRRRWVSPVGRWRRRKSIVARDIAIARA